MGGGGLPHDAAHKVVDNQVRPEFFADNVGAFAPKHIELQDALHVAQVDFHLPAAQVKIGDIFGLVALGVEKGRDEKDFLGPKAAKA